MNLQKETYMSTHIYGQERAIYNDRDLKLHDSTIFMPCLEGGTLYKEGKSDTPLLESTLS